MGLNLSVGNMFSFITSHWNPIQGCEYDCSYCWVNKLRYKIDRTPHLTESSLKTNLYGKGRGAIFVGATGDMWGNWVPAEDIERVLERCRAFPENIYLFLTKNPGRYAGFLKKFPEKTILGVTLETDKALGKISRAPLPILRVSRFMRLDFSAPLSIRRMVCIEPILKFDKNALNCFLQAMSPDFAVIGANSNGPEIPEPTYQELSDLIFRLNRDNDFRIVLKENLRRLLEPSPDGVLYEYADRDSSDWINHLWEGNEKDV